MSIGFSQLREVKRALTTFCDDNNLRLNDEDALKAAHELLRYAQQSAVTSDQLLHHLRSEKTMSSGGAASEGTPAISQ
jgi:hypothetical protein